MKVSLNISERVLVMSVLNEFKGKLETLAVILEDLKKTPPIAITEEEWIKAGRVVTDLPDGGKNWQWDDEKVGDVELELSSASANYVRETIEEKDKKGEFTIRDKAAVSLKKKLS